MNSNQSIEEKLRQQYKLAEFQRRMLVRELYQMIDVLEQRPRIRLVKPFPFGAFERVIQSGLSIIERKWLRKRWAEKKRAKR